MNVGFNTAQVLIKAYDLNGSVIGQTQTPFSLTPRGMLAFENILQTLGVTDTYGPVEIVSLNDVPLRAVSRVSGAGRSGGFFEGISFSDASRVQIIPHVVDSAELRTNLGINNVTNDPATVIVRLRDTNGSELGNLTTSVPAKGLVQLDHVVRQLVNIQGTSNLEGYVELESDQPILGWASQVHNVTNDPGFVVSQAWASTRLLVPSATQAGKFTSSLVIVNVGNDNALVDISSRGTDGAITGQLRSIFIPARGYFSDAKILESLGSSQSSGSVEIISTNGQPIIATSRIYTTSGTSGFLDGQSME
jgi:hypothetical protein